MKKIILIMAVLFSSLSAFDVCKMHYENSKKYFEKGDKNMKYKEYSTACIDFKMARYASVQFLANDCQNNYEDNQKIKDNFEAIIKDLDTILKPCN